MNQYRKIYENDLNECCSLIILPTEVCTGVVCPIIQTVKLCFVRYMLCMTGSYWEVSWLFPFNVMSCGLIPDAFMESGIATSRGFSTSFQHDNSANVGTRNNFLLP